MKQNCLWTKSKARLQLTQSCKGSCYNWVFLAGGPGLGSESLIPLTSILKLPGHTWRLDLPNDGSNVINNEHEPFALWSEALVEAVSALDHVILVGHSTGGMYCLATPPLEKLLKGIVLMDSAPNASWQQSFMQYVEKHPLPELQRLHLLYTENPTNALLKEMTIASASYLSPHAESLKDKFEFLKTLPYNHKSCDWSAKHFDETYQAAWIPKDIPTLIFAGDKDCITPLDLFAQSGAFSRKNILIQTIENAGHFPWIDNPKGVVIAFNSFIEKFRI